MADENPISPISAAEPPKANPLAKPAGAAASTLKLNPVVRKPVAGTALKTGLKLPPKPGATVATLRPGLKLPPKPGTATQSALKPGLKLPTAPGAATSALKPGLKLPARPQIRRPGEGSAVAPLPKPVTPAAAAEPEKPADKPEEAPAPVAKVDAGGVAKLPTVEAPAVKRGEPIVTPEPPKPIEALKSVTQKLKGITQSIPQQAILHKTGIIADAATSDAQKEAAKHKTSRISLADAIGAAPVKNENAPMKTIKIKRPIDIPGATKLAAPEPKPAAENAAAPESAAEPAKTEAAAKEPSPSVTQRKTLKIARPGGGAVRPAGKFGIKRPTAAGTSAPSAKPEENGTQVPPLGEVADIPEIADIPAMPTQPVFLAAAPAAKDAPAWLYTLSSLIQLAACIAMGALAWYLYQNTQIAMF